MEVKRAVEMDNKGIRPGLMGDRFSMKIEEAKYNLEIQITPLMREMQNDRRRKDICRQVV